MPIVPIRQFNRIDELLVSSHRRVRQCVVHQVPGTFQFRACEVRSILEEIADPFLVNLGRPMSTEGACQCQVHEEVAQPGRVEHICVEEGPECRHESDPDLLVVGSQFVECREAVRMDSPLVGHQGLKAHPAMGAHLPVLDLSFVEQ